MYLIQAFQDNPKSGALGTITSFLAGLIPRMEADIQTTVLFWFQIIAFTISIVVGVLTIIGFCRKLRKENCVKNEKSEADESL